MQCKIKIYTIYVFLNKFAYFRTYKHITYKTCYFNCIKLTIKLSIIII